MSSDEEILAEISKQTKNPRSTVEEAPQYPKSQFTVEVLKEKVGEMVWVKCVSDAKPWANNIAMEYWEDYQVSPDEAIMLDKRRFAVILEEPTIVNN